MYFMIKILSLIVMYYPCKLLVMLEIALTLTIRWLL